MRLDALPRAGSLNRLPQRDLDYLMSLGNRTVTVQEAQAKYGEFVGRSLLTKLAARGLLWPLGRAGGCLVYGLSDFGRLTVQSIAEAA